MLKGKSRSRRTGIAGVMFGVMFTGFAYGQSNPGTITLTDLSSFKDPGKTWKTASDVSADRGKNNTLNVAKGSGLIVNTPDSKTHGTDLYTTVEHGDADVEFDFMMAKGSNSGVYLQGRYEIQLLDSWGVLKPRAGDVGGIYERWDDSKTEGQKGYEGHAPRQNTGKAPGLWQHMKIAFQAPRFEGGGKKTENAKIVRIELNGVTIQEDVELTGPTRGAMSNDEKPTGPLRIQGDHGAVAFRNINVTTYSRRPSAAGDNDNTDPILLDAPVNTVLRSFMDLPGGPRVVHAVSVGSPQQVHYTYDMDKGTIVQVWRGDFLNTTPMWHDRGDGSSRPRGAVQILTKPVLTLAKLSGGQGSWTADTASTGYRPKGYTLDANDRPIFVYNIYGSKVTDNIQVADNGQGIRREISVENPGTDLYARIADGTSIIETGKGMYDIDGKSYFLRLDNSADAKASVRDTNGRKELIVPVKGKLSYSILF